MGDEKQYSIIPIYAIPVIWILWAIIFRFNSARSFIICIVVSVGIYLILTYIFPPKKATPIANTIPELTDENDVTKWQSLVKLSRSQTALLSGTPIATMLRELSDNIEEINKAIKADSTRASNPYVRKFYSYYIEYSEDLSDYQACIKISEPGPNVQKILRLTEERFENLSKVSKALLDEVYKSNILALSAENTVLKQVFAPLESKSDFDIEELKEL